jgi:hypothetical protein
VLKGILDWRCECVRFLASRNPRWKVLRQPSTRVFSLVAVPVEGDFKIAACSGDFSVNYSSLFGLYRVFLPR